MDLVVGVDAGGTTTRCVVADDTGAPVGIGVASGLNQLSSGGDGVAHLVAALDTALADHPPERVRAGVLAVAGAAEGGLPAAQQVADEAWRRLGLRARPVVVPDVLATFHAVADGAGRVLVAGTGAIAALVRDEEILRRADGYGWLLGDVGSAVWLGRHAASAALAALDGRGAGTALADAVLEHLRARGARDVVTLVHSRPPAALGRLAPLVVAAARDGDPVASGIVHRGVAGLLASVRAVGSDAAGPTVLGGALLTTDGPVRDGVLAGLRDDGVSTVRTATEPADGAVRIALRHLRRPAPHQTPH